MTAQYVIYIVMGSPKQVECGHGSCPVNCNTTTVDDSSLFNLPQKFSCTKSCFTDVFVFGHVCHLLTHFVLKLQPQGK